MNTSIEETNKGYLIHVETKQEIAIVVYSDKGERIYLPGEANQESTYYIEENNFLKDKEDGYAVMHDEEPEKVEIIS